MSIGVSDVYVEDPQGSATHMSRWVMDDCRYFTPAARCAMGWTAVRYADGTETAVYYAEWNCDGCRLCRLGGPLSYS